MDLKTRKYINNTKSLPKFYDGSYGYGMSDISGSLAANPNQFSGLMSFKPNEPASAMDQFSSFSNGQQLANQNAQNAIDPKALGTKSGLDVGKMAGYAQAAQSALNFAQTLASTNKYNKSADQIISEGYKTQGSIGGYGYTESFINEDREREEAAAQLSADTANNIVGGASTGSQIGGSIVPGLGHAIGAVGGALIGGVKSIFGNKSAKKEMEEKIRQAKEIASAGNLGRWSQAASMAENDRYQQEIGSKLGTITSFAYNGKDRTPGYFRGKDVDTAFGRQNGKQNAWVSKGEYIWDGGDNLSAVTRGPGDTAPAFLRGKDIVFTNNPNIPAPAGFKTIAQAVPYAAATGQLPQLAKHQEDMHAMGYYNGKDKMPKYGLGKTWQNIKGWLGKQDYSFLPNVITSGAGMLAGWNQYRNADSQSIKSPNIYEENPYEIAGLNELSGLRIDESPILRNIFEAERRGINDIKTTGGLTGTERMRGILAANYGSKKAYTDAIPNIQAQNNAYRSAYANAMLSAGQNKAIRKQQANQYDEEYTAKANAARQQRKEQGIYNVLNNLNQFYKNEWERRQFNDMMSLYRSDQKVERDKLDAILNGGNKSQAQKVAAVNSIYPTYSSNLSGALRNPEQFWGKNFTFTAPSVLQTTGGVNPYGRWSAMPKLSYYN